MYNMFIKRQIKRLSNYTDNIKMGRILLKIKSEIEKCFFSSNFLASDILLNNFLYSLKLYRHEVKDYMEGTVSQIFCIGFSFCFI